MAATVEIVVGPARSGKTAVLLDRLRKYIAGGGHDGSIRSAVWIAPTVRAASAIRERLLNDAFRGALGVSVVTFDQFARGIVESSTEEIRPISRIAQRRLLRKLIREANRRGELKHFGPIADTEGLLDTVVQFVQELKRREIWPDAFREILSDAPGGRKNQALANLYAAYQGILNNHRLYDDEGRFWVARSFLANQQRRPYAECNVVVVDGFSDLTRTQHEILEHLGQFVDHLAISLPCDLAAENARESSESLPPREDLFSKSRHTLKELCERHPAATTTQQNENTTDWPALDYVERRLFRPPQAIDSPDESTRPSFAQIQILRDAGEMQELATIAGQIKRRIVEDGARPEEILVVARSLGDRAAAIREVFAEFEIPIAIEARRPIASTAVVRGVLSLLRLSLRDWPFRDLLSIITNRAMRFDTGVNADVDAEKISAERIVRRLQIDRGRKSLLDRVDHLASALAASANESAEPVSETPSAVDTTSSLHRDAQLAAPYLNRISESLEELPDIATAREWAIALERLALACGLLPIPTQGATDKHASAFASEATAAWSLLIRGVVSADAFAKWTNSGDLALDRNAILELLTDVASQVVLPAEHDDVGRVRILSAPSARAIRTRHLYVIGLTEGSFPQPSSQERLFSESEIAQFSNAGLRFDSRGDRAEEEMLLFYEVITRAESSLTLSYPGLDEKATPLPPSPFLTEFDRLCGDYATRVEHVDPSPINRQFDPASASEFRVRAVADAVAARDQEPDICRLGQLLARMELSPTAAAIDAGLRITVERSSGKSFGPAEGVAFPATGAVLAKLFGPEHAWSTSQLERYAYCPFQFYAERILKLEPLDGLKLTTNYLRRGKLMHDALANFHARIRDVVAELAVTESVEEQEMFQGLQAELNALVEATPLWGVEEALRELEVQDILDWAENYFAQHAEYDVRAADLDHPFIPTHFEVRFGPPRGDDGPEDALSTDDAFELDIGDEKIKIVGRIDRVDIGQVAGKVVFNVIDFKTGLSAALTDEQITTGVKLQIPLYAMALEKHVLKDQNAVAWEADYWWLKDVGFGKKANQRKDTPKTFQMREFIDGEIKSTERWTQLTTSVIEAVRGIVHGVRAGAFPMHCADENCTSRCDFRTVCRVGQVRSLGKVWPPEIETEDSGEQKENA